MYEFAPKFAAGLKYHDFLNKYGTEEHRRRWQGVYDRVELKLAQRQTLDGFVRQVKVLVFAGAWCGDCVNQCPIFERFAEAAPTLDIRYVDRDADEGLKEALKICGGNRVPVVVFLSEDDQFVGLYGDRTLSKYKQMALDQLGPSCPTGIAPPSQDLLDAVTQDWLNEFERVHLILRLSSRLRQLHGD